MIVVYLAGGLLALMLAAAGLVYVMLRIRTALLMRSNDRYQPGPYIETDAQRRVHAMRRTELGGDPEATDVLPRIDLD